VGKIRKPLTMWCMKYNDGALGTWSIRWTRRGVVSCVERNFTIPWKEIKKFGHTIVKVEVKEVSGE